MSTTTRTLWALRTTSGRLVIIALAPDADPWLAAVRYVREYLERDEFLVDMAPATVKDVAAVRAADGYVPEGRLAMA